MIHVRLFEDLDAAEADAAHALDRGAQASLYDRTDWFQANRRHGIVTGRPIVACARDGADAAWLFLAADGAGGAVAYGGWYTLAFAPIFAGSEGARPALLAAIATALRARLRRIVLAPLDGPSCGLIQTAFGGNGWSVRADVSSANWVAHVAGGDFAAYWARRPSRLRNTVRRKAKDGGLAIAIHDRFDAAAWADYEAVYAASWKPEEGSPAFLRAMAEAEGAAGTLRLGIARRAGQPVAAQLWTVEGGHATIHKLAYAESERARSPGSVLSEAMFAHVIGRDRPAIVDFGTGDDAYKADWMDEKRPLYRVALYNRRSLRGLAGLARETLAGWRRAR